MKRQRLIFPCSCPHSIVRAEELNCRVRDGNGCTLFAVVTGSPAQTGDPCSLVQLVHAALRKRAIPSILLSEVACLLLHDLKTKSHASSLTPPLLLFIRVSQAYLGKQAVRSLGRLRSTCYQMSTRRLSTRSSPWDLHHTYVMGELILGPASRLDAFSAYPF